MVEARSLSVARITKGVRALDGVKGRIAEMGNGSERFLLGWRRISAGLSQILWSAIIGEKFRAFPGMMILSLSHGCDTRSHGFLYSKFFQESKTCISLKGRK